MLDTAPHVPPDPFALHHLNNSIRSASLYLDSLRATHPMQQSRRDYQGGGRDRDRDRGDYGGYRDRERERPPQREQYRVRERSRERGAYRSEELSTLT
jgi:hypothetical protein